MLFEDRDLLRLQLTGILDNGLDLMAFVFFLAFAATYIVVPRLGYEEERPVGLASSLFLLIGYACLLVLQRLALLYLLFMNRLGGNRLGTAEFFTELLMAVFPLIKMAIFVFAMLSFLNGIRGLTTRRRPPDFYREQPPPQDE